MTGSSGPAGPPVRVVTYNTAVGNPRFHVDERLFLSLPFYGEVIAGSPDAPILALQEVGPGQADALRKAAQRGGFRLVHISRPGQGNALLIPSRYALLRAHSQYFLGPPLRLLAPTVLGRGRRGERPNWRQLLELRMWSRAHLRDAVSGRAFTVFNTHLSGWGPLRVAQARSLAARVRHAQEDGPVILAGDLNTRTPEAARPDQERWDAQVRGLLDGLGDMGTSVEARRLAALDWVLASGFRSVRSRVWSGDSLALPGHPRAESISDHLPEDDLLAFT